MSESECELEVGPAKRPKKGYMCKYKREWKSFGMSCSRRGPNFAHCDVCNVEVSISHGGINDVKKHHTTTKHKDSQKASDSSKSLGSFFPTSASAFDSSVIRSEVLFANFIAKHNLPFLLADHYTHLAHVMFPDSKIADAFSSARTKTTCVVKGALFPYFTDPVYEMCRNGPFSILCDEGTDCDDKNFAILVRIWDKNQEKPVTRFFDVPICNIGDAATFFDHLDNALSSKGVLWNNVVGFESDTTNVMVGKHNSVLSRVKSKQPKVFSLGCVCHLANLCLLAGVSKLPIDIDDFFVDLYYFFDKSAKRKQDLREFQEFTGTSQLKILKHCKTRWLSLERAVKRVLVQWDALYAYFDKEAESNHAARVLRLDAHFKSQKTKLVLLFLELH